MELLSSVFGKVEVSDVSLLPVLQSGETTLSISQDVGLYYGQVRMSQFDKGTVHLTTHRILYINSASPKEFSLEFNLSNVKNIQITSGFVTTSGKIIIEFQVSKTTAATAEFPSASPSTNHHIPKSSLRRHWACLICQKSNSNLDKCDKCGVKRTVDRSKRICPDCTYVNGAVASCDMCKASLVDFESEIPAESVEGKLKSDDLTCCKCTFLNPIGSLRCEMCESLILDTRSLSAMSLGNNDTGNKETLDSVETYIFKFSFRSGGSQKCFEVLQRALVAREWMKSKDAQQLESVNKPSKATSSAAGIGISSILRNVNSQTANMDTTIHEAFHDLDALMENAAEMVKLCENISGRLMSQLESSSAGGGLRGGDQEEQLNLFKRQLMDLGIASPVTKKSAGTAYHACLARELCEFLDKVLASSRRNMVSLSDVYCLFNRARGTELISPQDLLRAVEMMRELGLGFRVKEFRSGVKCILRSRGQDFSSSSSTGYSGVRACNQDDDDEAEETNRVLQAIPKSGGKMSAMDWGLSSGCGFVVAESELHELEERGLLCRDESQGGVEFFANMILNYS